MQGIWIKIFVLFVALSLCADPALCQGGKKRQGGKGKAAQGQRKGGAKKNAGGARSRRGRGAKKGADAEAKASTPKKKGGRRALHGAVGPPLTITAERESLYSLEVGRETGSAVTLFPLSRDELISAIVKEAADYPHSSFADVTTRRLRFICGPDEPFGRLADVVSDLSKLRPTFSKYSFITARGEREIRVPIYTTLADRDAAGKAKRLVFTVQKAKVGGLSSIPIGDLPAVLRIGQGSPLDRLDLVRGLRAIVKGSPDLAGGVVSVVGEAPCEVVHLALALVQDVFQVGAAPHLALSEEPKAPPPEPVPDDIVLAAEKPLKVPFEIVVRVLSEGQPEYVSAVVTERITPPEEEDVPAEEAELSAVPASKSESRGTKLTPAKIKKPATFRSFSTGIDQFAVENGLVWLTKVQEQNGSWGTFEEDLDPDSRLHRIRGLTGLCTLSLIQSGVTVASGRFKETTGLAIDFLCDSLDQVIPPDGSSTGIEVRARGPQARDFSAEILTAASALMEGFGATGEKRRRSQAQKALQQVVSFQNPDGGFGRRSSVSAVSGPTSPGGSSVSDTARAAMVFHAAFRAGVHFPQSTLLRLIEFLKQTPFRNDPTHDSALIFARSLVLDGGLNGPARREARRLLSLEGFGLPVVDSLLDLDTLQFRLTAAYQAGGTEWQGLKQEAMARVSESQRAEGQLSGSFGLSSESLDLRILRTAYSLLLLSTPERYDRFSSIK